MSRKLQKNYNKNIIIRLFSFDHACSPSYLLGNGFGKSPSSTINQVGKKKKARKAFIRHHSKATMIAAYFLIATFYLCEPVVFIVHDKFTSKEAFIMTHFLFHQQLSSRPTRHKARIFP